MAKTDKKWFLNTNSSRLINIILYSSFITEWLINSNPNKDIKLIEKLIVNYIYLNINSVP